MSKESIDSAVINKISYCISKCTRNINDLKVIIEEMIRDRSINDLRSNNISKSLFYIDSNINTLENLFLEADTLSHDKEIRKRYVVLIENTISDFKEFRQKLDKLRMYNDDIRHLTEYLESTTI